MQEHKFTLPTADGKTIYGVRTGDATKPAVVVVHGYARHANDYQLKRFAQLTETQFCTYRFNLYDGRENARHAHDCTFATHALDIAGMLEMVKSQHEKIFMLGHSFGGPSIMVANPEGVAAVSLWDPSYNIFQAQKDFASRYEDAGEYYLLQAGFSCTMSKRMYDAGSQFTQAKCAALSADAKFPVQVVLAGAGYYADKGESFDTLNTHGHRRDVVPDADHSFWDGNTADIATLHSVSWFNQWI